MDTFGVYLVTVISIIAHTNILRFIRHWDPLYFFFFCFGWVWIPFDLWDEDGMPDSRVQGAVGPSMFYNLNFLLNMLLVVVIIMLPLVITRFRRTFWLEPHLYCVE